MLQNTLPKRTLSVCLAKIIFANFILLFSLFVLLFMGPTTFLDTIHGSHYTISANFYLYL